MSGKLDQSLDQIVKTNRSSARNTRRGRPAAKGAKAAAAPAGGIKKHGKASRPSGKVVVPTAPAVKVSGDRVEKIVVSNLPFDVTEDQIQVR
ncbi:MAG: hypothetical protein M1819_004437 [Sarea resinae]|nr:MAG: hypothetical protein M1819_004437 [Sarea resinae]